MMRIGPTPSIIMSTTHQRCQLGQLQELRQRSIEWACTEYMELEELGRSEEHEGQPLIQLQEEPNSCGTMG